ncbi:MAG: aspartate aminotransferase family protein, partial [Acidobacteriota bacterium]
GRHIWTADGQRLLDGASGALAATLGYGVGEIAAAITSQAATLPAAHSLAFGSDSSEAYAAALAGVLPADLERPFFVTGGTEAMEMAMLVAHRIQAARGEPQRRLFLSRHLSYHGCSLATLALGARVALRQPVSPLLRSVPHLPPPYPYRPEWHRRFPGPVAGVEGLGAHCQQPLSEEAIERGRAHPAEALAVALEALGPGQVAAFVGEPIIGASAGAVVPPPDYWPRVRQICDRHGVLWIADEVMTGMGRTGSWLAACRWEVVPDIVVLGKGLSAAYQPLGAVVIREKDWQALNSRRPGFPYGFTFANHPLATAAGRAVLELLEQRSLLARAERLGAQLRQRLRAELEGHPHVSEVRGAGLMIGIELVEDRQRRSPFPAQRDLTGRLLAAAAEAGVLLYPARGGADGTSGDALLVAPALTITDEECDELIDGVVRALNSLPVT